MTLLRIVTVIEIAALLLVLVAYLAAIGKRLQSISNTLGTTAFGVRAVETQTSSIGPSVVALNEELEAIVGGLPDIAEKAERLAAKSM